MNVMELLTKLALKILDWQHYFGNVRDYNHTVTD